MLAFMLIVGSYLLGSLSAAIIVCHVLKLPDPRTTGSKNPGATNVLRIGGKKTAVIVLLGDALKGFLPVMIGKLLGVTPLVLALMALAAFIGHVFPVFFRFEGGKGVATAAGAVVALSPLLALICLIIWATVCGYSRISSLSALVAATLLPLMAWLLHENVFVIPLAIMAGVIIYRHKANILRLSQGTEPQVGKK